MLTSGKPIAENPRAFWGTFGLPEVPRGKGTTWGIPGRPLGILRYLGGKVTFWRLPGVPRENSSSRQLTGIPWGFLMYLNLRVPRVFQSTWSNSEVPGVKG